MWRAERCRSMKNARARRGKSSGADSESLCGRDRPLRDLYLGAWNRPRGTSAENSLHGRRSAPRERLMSRCGSPESSASSLDQMSRPGDRPARAVFHIAPARPVGQLPVTSAGSDRGDRLAGRCASREKAEARGYRAMRTVVEAAKFFDLATVSR